MGTGGAGGASGGTGGTSAGGGSGGGPGLDAAADTRPVDMAPPDLRPVDVAPPDLRPVDVPAVMVDMAPPVMPPPANVNLAMGLISRFKLDEGMGTAAADIGPGANNATVSGAAWRPGAPGTKYPNTGSLHFDGTDDFVDVPNRMMPANNGAQSETFWVNYTAAPSGARVCVSLTQPSSESRLKIGFNDGQVRVWKSSSDPLVSAPIPPPGWHHYAYTFDGRVHRLYLDGLERAMSTTAANTGPAAEVRLGAIHNNAENFLGDLDDVRFYNRALNADEVRALAQGLQ